MNKITTTPLYFICEYNELNITMDFVMSKLNNIIYYAITLNVFLFFINHLTLQPPASKPITAPSNEFSGERAFGILSHLLSENKGHPVGSELNKLVKQRIIDELSKFNISSTVQKTWSCSFHHNNCAFVENIVAVIPGETDSDYVALMAHYDSVPMAPGAGDDGAAVAAMLESARILKAEAPFKRPILLLFTDAEEVGLIGAEAFFRQHELAKKVSVVLDFEGSGSTGISQVLRTSGANQVIINAFQRESSYPKGASLINEIFKRMPNDTDFSVALRAKIPGIDFAFTGERNHYHTPNDNIENIDHRSIQHHGENMLPTTRWLANNEIVTTEPNYVYMHFYNTWSQWTTTFSPYLLALSLIFIALAYKRTEATALGVFGGFSLSLLVMFTTILVSFVTFKLIAYFQGTTVSFPANDLAYRIALFSSALTGALVAALVSNRYFSFINAMLGAWVFWLALSIPLFLYMPDAVNVLLVPLLSGTLFLAISTYFSNQSTRTILLLSLIFLLPSTLGIVLLLESSQGYNLIVATMPFLALFMTIFVPLIHGSRLKTPLTLAAIITTVSMITAIMSPLYSVQRPQLVNIIYIEDLDAGTAYYYFDNQNPLPDNLTSVVELTTEKKALVPYIDFQQSNWVAAKSSGYQAPKFTVESITANDKGRTVELILSSPRIANTLQLILPASAKLKHFALGSIEFEPKLIKAGSYKDKYSIKINGSFAKDVPLTLVLDSLDPVNAYLLDRSTELPESAASMLEQRTNLISPVHGGDLAILVKKINF